jgi:hypothetical protein
MLTRLKFAGIAGAVGFLLGCAAAAVLHKPEEAFPYYLIVAFSATFSVCGAVAKREWIQEVVAFFVSKIP